MGSLGRPTESKNGFKPFEPAITTRWLSHGALGLLIAAISSKTPKTRQLADQSSTCLGQWVNFGADREASCQGEQGACPRGGRQGPLDCGFHPQLTPVVVWATNDLLADSPWQKHLI
jgi:hypothetical protein